MHSRNLTTAERAHMGAVKALPCSVCAARGPSHAHHIVQGDHFTVVALCWECHQGPQGWHGDKTIWRIHKMDELKALNVTLSRLHGNESRRKAYKAPSKIIPRRAPDAWRINESF